MEANQEKMAIRDLVELRRNNMLVVNMEYQRGAVWTDDQQKKLIDSVLRGYPIPILYLHKISRKVGDLSRDDLEIIDGQQRLNALYLFVEGALRLYDPQKDLEKAKFPSFIRDVACEWGGVNFSRITREDAKQFFGYRTYSCPDNQRK